VLAGAWSPTTAGAAAPSALALAPRRQGVYGALMASLQGAADANLRAADAARATEAFSGWYEKQPPTTRTHADAILDHLGARGLQRGNAPTGLKTLRNLSGAGKAHFSDREAVDAAAVAAALALAAQSAAPAPEEDDVHVVGVLSA